jgi:hypothetical protein
MNNSQLNENQNGFKKDIIFDDTLTNSHLFFFWYSPNIGTMLVIRKKKLVLKYAIGR